MAESGDGERISWDVDRSPCALARTDGKGTFLAVNQTLCEWSGRSRAELVGHTRLQDLLTMGGRIFLQTHWQPLLEMQGSIAEVKLDLRTTAGNAVPVVLNAIRRDGVDGTEHDLAMFLARDRDRYEKELLLSRKKLELAVADEARMREEAKDRALFAEQMIGIVSHDLRNPLSAIQMGMLALERGDTMTEKQRAVLARVSRSASRATRLVEQLLDFTLARTGKQLSVVLRELSLHEVAGYAVEELKTANPGRLLLHEMVGDGRCSADSDRLEQLIGNLVANALAYGLADSPVTVRTAVDGRSAEITVHNSGSPIPADKQNELFQPMVRGQTGPGSAGVGLGLYIVSEIAKALGGSVSVQSGEAEGTTFKVVFPAH